jgi:two-component system, NtrC family, sensor histidine kinase HydH
MRRFLPQAAIGLVIVLITVLHFLTPLDKVVWHEIYQRLYYIPIIAAALLFGLRGGLAASIFTTVVYSPHGHFDYSINQYAEIVIFNLVGGVMGALGDRLKLARERAERNAEERQKAYDELQKTFEQLLQAEKLSSLGELSAGIVHEVRNPLAAIKGAVEILEDELAEDSPRREFADLAKKEVERLDKLVGEFLRFARPATLSVGENDLNKIVESVISLVENQATAQSVSIERNLHKNLPKVSVDGEQIKQVLLNLAINSLQAESCFFALSAKTNFALSKSAIPEAVLTRKSPVRFSTRFSRQRKKVLDSDFRLHIKLSVSIMAIYPSRAMMKIPFSLYICRKINNCF